jgi:hypothetical protein
VIYDISLNHRSIDVSLIFSSAKCVSTTMMTRMDIKKQFSATDGKNQPIWWTF